MSHRSASKRTVSMDSQHCVSVGVAYWSDMKLISCLIDSSPSSAPVLDLLLGVRLHVPACHHRPSSWPRTSHAKSNRPIPWEMALLPAVRHTRAVLRPILSNEFPGPSKRHGQNPRVDTVEVPAETILFAPGIFRIGKLDFQHDFPYTGFQRHREAGLLRRRRQCVIWPVLHANPAVSTGSPCQRVCSLGVEHVLC